MENNFKKSYNPFKMWGSWLGFILGLATIDWSINYLYFLHPIWLLSILGYKMDPGAGILAALISPIVFLFTAGQFIHFLEK